MLDCCITQKDDWITKGDAITRVSITKQRAITIFDRFNGTILDVNYLDQQAAEPANYTADDLFPIFDLVFKVPPGDNYTEGLEWNFLTWFLVAESNNNTALRPQQFQRLIALPVLYFSTTTLGYNLLPAPSDIGISESFARPVSRVGPLKRV